MDHVSPQHQHDADAATRHDRAVDAVAGWPPRRALPAALALVATLVCLALGIWQLDRRASKLALIERVERRLAAPPQPLPPRAAWPSLTERNAAYRRVRLAGTMEHAAATLVQAVTARGAGFWLMTPLRLGDATVLVNRGFVPASWRDPRRRGAAPDQPGVTVTGLIRMSEPGGGFLRANDPRAERWYSRDVAAIAHARKLGPTAPFFVDADAVPGAAGYPIGGLTVVRFANNHLIYALTWFALAGLSAAALARIVRVR